MRHVLNVGVAGFNEFRMCVARFLLEFVDMWHPDWNQFQSTLVGVEPSPLFQGGVQNVIEVADLACNRGSFHLPL